MMRAAVFNQFQGPVQVQSVPLPDLEADAVLIRVQACGICRSDWHGWMGHDSDVQLPHVPGHELAGVVAAAGADVQRWRGGERVTVPFCCGCGSCEQCAAGHTHICDRYTQPGFTQWGAFAEYVRIRHADVNLVALPDSIEFVTAASLGCRFATSFHGLVNQAQVTADDVVAVFGCGGVGLSAIMIASAFQAQVIAIDIREQQLKKARECGAAETLNASGCEDVAATIRRLTNGGPTITVDALGSRQTCFEAIRSLRKRGRHVQIGLTLGPDSDPPVPMSAVIARELQIIGSHGMAVDDYPRMLDLISTGSLQPDRLVGETVSLEQAGDRLTRLNDFSSAGAVIIDRF